MSYKMWFFSKALNVVGEYYKVSLAKAFPHIRSVAILPEGYGPVSDGPRVILPEAGVEAEASHSSLCAGFRCYTLV